MRTLPLPKHCQKAGCPLVRPSMTAIVATLLMVGAPARAADDPVAAASPALTPASGVVMLDYQSLKVVGDQPIDLVGFHYLNRFNDWLSLGLGGHAPLARGDYGGFMAFDATIHAERRLIGNLSAMAGASLGGGGGGRNTEQSKLISGAGGFVKTYAGLGYRFDDVTVGVNYSHIRFTRSAIDSSQFGVFLQLPVSFSIAPYADAGRIFASSSGTQRNAPPRPSDDDVLVFGSDNIVQLNPQGSNKRTINLVDVQYDHFVTRDVYALFGGSVGYHGIAGYNQVYGGLGYRVRASKGLTFNAQLAIGSGGYAPDKIDTGSGLLIHPKLSAEYRFSDAFGLLVSSGYLFAPHGSSRNATLGAALVYHADGDGARSQPQAADLAFRGHRVSTFLQTEFKVNVGDRYQSQLKLLSTQVDTDIDPTTYLPVQGSIAYDSYLGYPGYGEVLAGLGLQTRYRPGDTFQTFAQWLVGTNIHGIITKPAVGVNVTVSDRFAMYGQVGSTVSLDSLGLYPKQYRFRSTSVGLGLTWRFALPR